MGFLKHLLFWPVTGPAYLARFSLEKVQGVVKDELTDDARVKEGLLDLQLRLELGEIDDEEYVREEERLMEELRQVRRWREEFGMATRGGVVQVAQEAPETRPVAEGSLDDEARTPKVVEPGVSLEITLDWDEPDEGSGSR
jgi:hypothetical protein